MSVNARFDTQVMSIFDPLREIGLTYLKVGDLISLSRTCKVFRELVRGDSKSARLIEIFKKLSYSEILKPLKEQPRWLDHPTALERYIEWGVESGQLPFPIAKSDFAMITNKVGKDLKISYANYIKAYRVKAITSLASASIFMEKTLLAVATWLREKGNTPIAPHGIGLFQPREALPTEYISAIDLQNIKTTSDRSIDQAEYYNQYNAQDIYHHLERLHNTTNTDPQYGEKAFYDRDGFSSTAVEKAAAIENSIFFRVADAIEDKVREEFKNFLALKSEATSQLAMPDE